MDATQAILDRIDRLDPRLKSYATLTRERALADAAARDAETAAGTSRGPLHGVPIAVKDLCNTEGVATAAGMAIHRANVPTEDATVVARLKAKGAVILGKLQMTEGAFGAHHPSIPAPLNPWNAAYWTGSSSSGSGAATAAGLCFASLGSDTGGSIRFPCTMNGLTGLKPTWGRVSRAGVFPLAESLDHIGPMTRSALDCAIVLGVIAGADERDPTAVTVAGARLCRGRSRQGVKGKRIGRPVNLAGLDDDGRRALDGAIEVLGKAGATILDVALPAGFDQAAVDWVPLCAVECAIAHEATYPARAGEYGSVLAGLIDVGRRLSGTRGRPSAAASRGAHRRAQPAAGLGRSAADAGDAAGGVVARGPGRCRTGPGDGGDAPALHRAVRHERPSDPHAARRHDARRHAGRLPDRRRAPSTRPVSSPPATPISRRPTGI